MILFCKAFKVKAVQNKMHKLRAGR